jgi:hypothetical protein
MDEPDPFCASCDERRHPQCGAARDRPASMCKTLKTQNPSCDRTKIDFCGQQIEIFEQLDTNERLAPEIVKLKWRKGQILIKHLDSRTVAPRGRKSTVSDLWRWGSHRVHSTKLDFSACESLESIPCDQHADHQDTSKSNLDSLPECPDDCAHALWSGWLRWKRDGISSLFSSRQTWWCVLNVENARIRLECLDMDASSGLMRAAKSVILDPTMSPTLYKSRVGCSTCTQVLIREQGSGHRHRLSCETPEEVERLLLRLRALLRSVHVHANDRAIAASSIGL